MYFTKQLVSYFTAIGIGVMGHRCSSHRIPTIGESVTVQLISSFTWFHSMALFPRITTFFSFLGESKLVKLETNRTAIPPTSVVFSVLDTFNEQVGFFGEATFVERSSPKSDGLLLLDTQVPT